MTSFNYSSAFFNNISGLPFIQELIKELVIPRSSHVFYS